MASSSNDDADPPPPPRHRADDDLEALANGSDAFAPVAVPDLLGGSASPLSSDDEDGETNGGGGVRRPSSLGDSDYDEAEERLGVDAGVVMGEDDVDVDVNEPLEMQYDSDDDDDLSVDDDGGAASDAAELLSKRTSLLMDNFRDYVSTMGEEGGENQKGGKSPGRSPGVNGDVGADLEEGHDAPLLIKGEDWYNKGLLKDFNIEEEDDDLDIDQMLEGGAPRNHFMRYKYTWLRSKRVKRGIIMVALAAIVIAIIAGAASAKKQRNLPDWNKELDEMREEEEYEHVNVNGDVLATPSEPLQQPTEKKEKEEEEVPFQNVEYVGLPSNKDKPNSASDMITEVMNNSNNQSPQQSGGIIVADDEATQLVTQKYSPIWYSRANEYDATTWEDAVVFCGRQNMRVPCPYSAYCPNGAGHAPYGGEYKDEPYGAWSPVLDSENEWVLVSANLGKTNSVGNPHGDDGAGGCMMYNYLHSRPPEWGEEEGTNEEQTRHVLCCVETEDEKENPAATEEVSAGIANEETIEGKEPDVTDEDNFSQQSSLEGSSANEETVEGEEPAVSDEDDFSQQQQQEKQQPQQTQMGQSQMAPKENQINPEDILIESHKQPIDEAVVAQEYADAEAYNPKWFGREDGWTGRTYDEAVDFCAAVNVAEGIPDMGALCPYEVICPTGPHHIPYGGMVQEPEGSWSPMADSYNDWVMIGEGTNNAGAGGGGGKQNKLCLSYMNQNLMAPTWGITGEANESITRYVLCCTPPHLGGGSVEVPEEEVADEEDADEEEQVMPPVSAEMGEEENNDDDDEFVTTVEEAANHPEYEEVEKFQPVLYDRSSGWTGQTYNEGVHFCKSKGKSTELCSYDVYCPLGYDNMPYGGFVDPDSPHMSWAPIRDSYNDWVHLGKMEGMNCETFMRLNEVQPDWGISGDNNEEITRSIMCCNSQEQEGEADETSTGGVGDIQMEDQMNEMDESETEESTVEASLQQDDADEYMDITFDPIWYDRNSGWKGKTYAEAVSFCGDGGREICPYQAICPNGKFQNSPPHGNVWQLMEKNNDNPKNEFWAPFSNAVNDWIMIGNREKETCNTYVHMNNEVPSWGVSGNGSMGQTGYVMCCKTPNSEVLEGEDSTPSTSASEPPMLDIGQEYQESALAYEPIWYGRSEGWPGQTYNEAIGFCRAQKNSLGEQMMVCPYSVYCPLGEGGVPYGGIKEEGQRGSWAPIVNSENNWVSLDNNNKCMEYKSLYPDGPAWGITGEDNEDMTRHVMCCHSKGSNVVSNLNVGGSDMVTDDAQEESSASSPTGDDALVDEAVQMVTDQGPPVSKELQAVYSMLYSRIDKKLQPVPHDRMSGWVGQVFSEAEEYCKVEESKIPCTVEALCPNGIGDGDALVFDDGPVWAAVEDIVNPWVEIRDGGYCVEHTNLPKLMDVTRYVFCCNTAGEASDGPDNGNIPFEVIPASKPQQPQPAPSPVISTPVTEESDDAGIGEEEMDKIFELDEQKFHAVGYDRSQGWKGQSYGEALEFCAKKNSKIPCPYEAICPMAENGPPVGGEKQGTNGMWVPIIDSANGWVQVGYVDTCRKYTDMKPHPPSWGLTGKENEAITRHIMCCDEPAGTGPPINNEQKEIDEVTQTEEIVMSTMHPMWFGREDGYHGTTHEEAELFCRTIGNLHLCPVEAYCPNGPLESNALFLQQDAFEDEQWAPISNYDNEDTSLGNNWIMIGSKDGDPSNICLQYEELNKGKSPPWTADGSKTELKEHVLCCAQQESIKHEQDVSRGMNPIWMDNSHGWSGGSYDDAVKFCHDLGGKRICPYAAYCPHGPGMQPMGQHSANFNYEGEQWAPVFAEGVENNWVQIGTKYGNSATTCFSHVQLEGSPPEWGMSGDNSSAKRHIQCCSF